MKLPKTVLITGANGQTAIHLAAKLLEKRCRLLLLAHNRTDRIERLIALYPERCRLEKCDLSNVSDTARTIDMLMKDAGKSPHALVHMAAIRSFDAMPLASSDPAIWSGVVYQNITMAYNAMRCVLPYMHKLRSGKIVLMGSNVTRTGLPFGSAYAAAKSALANLVRSLAIETAGYNIQVNMVSPGPIDTKLEEDYSGRYLEFRRKYFENYMHNHPAHELVGMEEVASTIMTLLDLDIKSVSGEEIYLTGGVL
jgi:3-oxoacyl-[acyl-carrier protein] reductase